MEIVIGTGKVLLALFVGIFIMGIFACFSGESDIGNVDRADVILCIIIGIGAFIMTLYVLFD